MVKLVIFSIWHLFVFLLVMITEIFQKSKQNHFLHFLLIKYIMVVNYV